jgi:cation transport ATPase
MTRWEGWPFFQCGWASVVTRRLNMFTLIALGVGAAFGYSLVATIVPLLFLASFRMGDDIQFRVGDCECAAAASGDDTTARSVASLTASAGTLPAYS